MPDYYWIAAAACVVAFAILAWRHAARAERDPSAEKRPASRRRRDATTPRFLVVVDFECTCVRDACAGRKTPWRHEIIEFPAVLIDLDDAAVDPFRAPTFHRFVRPTERPRLTEFCSATSAGLDDARTSPRARRFTSSDDPRGTPRRRRDATKKQVRSSRAFARRRSTRRKR